MDVRQRRGALASKPEKRGAVTTLVFALVLIAWIGEWPVRLDSAMYYGKWRSVFVVFGPLFTPVPGISLFPWQLMVLALAPFCFGAANAKYHAREMDRAILVGLLAIAATILWGLAMGGSAYFAYHQVWRILLALLLGFMVMSALRTERDLILLARIVVIAALIRATLCIYHYWAHLHGNDDPTREYVTNHEDTMLFVMAVEIMAIWAFYRGGRAAWLRATLVILYVLYAVILNDRRLAWVELAVAMPLLYLLIGPGPLRKQVNKWALIAAIPLVAYVGMGKVSSSPIFAPVHAMASTGSDADASSLAREEEIRNLMRTLGTSGNPVFGTGWGRPYLFAERAYNNYDSAWILAPYTPHNSLIGLATYSGLVGVLGIWGLMPLTAFLAARGFRNANGNHVVQGAAMASIGAVCSYGIQCYGDIGLQSFQGAVLFGVALGTAGRISVWGTAPESPVAAMTARTGRARQKTEAN